MIYLILTSLIWAFSYGLIKGNLAGLSPDFLASARMAIPLLLFLPFFKPKNLNLKKILTYLLIGAVQYGLMYLLVIRAYAHLPAHQIILFTAFTPIYVTLIHDGLSRSFKPMHLAGAIVALLSVFALHIKTLGSGSSFTGFILVQLSDLCFAFGQVAYKLYKKEEKTNDVNLYALPFLGGLMITSISTTMFQGWGSLFILSWAQILLLIYLGAIASGLCFFWWNKASLAVNAGTLAVCNNLKIPLGILVCLTIFKESADIPALLISGLLMTLAIGLIESKTFFSRINPLKPR